MEVYHPHKHNSASKAKTLIFEFFMMFLAITGGFFMENLREHSIERHKETAYIESMVKDVRQDTIAIQNIITNSEKQIKGIDSLRIVLESPFSEINYRRMYLLTFKYLNNFEAFTPNQITISQLKNFGGLRLINNKPVSDSIVNYYSTFDEHVEQQNYTVKFLQETILLETVAMDFNAARNNSSKLTFDQNKFKEFRNRILLFESLLNDEICWVKSYQKQSISLLKNLKKGYKIETTKLN
jgi:hypothetical protein